MNKIKVLQVVPALTHGGISSVVMNWYRQLDKRQYQFDFISFNDGPLHPEITAMGGRVWLIPTLKQQPFLHLKAVIKLLSAAPRYQVVHVHNSFKNVVLLWLAKCFGVKVRVCHSHTSGLENSRLRPVIGLLKSLTTAASNVHLACGQAAGLFLYGGKPFTVINNAICLEKFAVSSGHKQPHQHLPSNKTLLLQVGRFSKVKNHQFLLQLAKQPSLADDIHFVCVGEGPLKAQFCQQITRLNLQSRFTVLPATAAIANLLQSVDGFIMPSLFEGVSVALLEAQAAALPCLIADTISTESDMGLGIVSRHGLDDLASWLTTLNNLPQVQVSQAQIHAAYAERGYTTDSVLRQLIAFYQLEEPS
ncbi:glycosyltransferase EpsF [Colwellia chukchiensis]|uniref:Glycosyltransferase EpsF n=1 Tax=Colwellia chukchiensis TaxID=641665 RepID=A0A1H7PUT7_9GAMM|nr:glycosyltransferase [Colwellia chukchiensis]SEL39248.1 glycosyltransferase EpsF [Colwellia chukchiensis]